MPLSRRSRQLGRGWVRAGRTTRRRLLCRNRRTWIRHGCSTPPLISSAAGGGGLGAPVGSRRSGRGRLPQRKPLVEAGRRPNQGPPAQLPTFGAAPWRSPPSRGGGCWLRTTGRPWPPGFGVTVPGKPNGLHLPSTRLSAVPPWDGTSLRVTIMVLALLLTTSPVPRGAPGNPCRPGATHLWRAGCRGHSAAPAR